MAFGRSALLTIGALIAAGCTSGSPADTRSYRRAECIPEFELPPDTECGFLAVPENRGAPNERTIRLAVARLKATSQDPDPEPLLWLQGGPGGSALAGNLGIQEMGFNANRDVILLEQRGTYKSEPQLSCPEVTAAKVDSLDESYLDPRTARSSGQAVQACADRLRADGIDLSAYNTPENAADAADLRVALGIPEWDVYGVSYGSDVALHLLRDHPAGIRAVVLDSVLPPEVNDVDEAWPAAAEGLQALVDECAAQPPCAGAFPDLKADYETAVRELTGKPVTVAVRDPDTGERQRVVVDGYGFANFVAEQSIAVGTMDALPGTIHAAAAGDVSWVAAGLAESAFAGGPGYGLLLGVYCREDAAFTDPAQQLARARQVFPDLPESVLSLSPTLPFIFDDCAAWNAGRATQDVNQATTSDVPVLVLAGALDAVTPVSWARSAAARLPESQLVVVPGAGHDVAAWSRCARTAIDAFLSRPTAPRPPCQDRPLVFEQ